MIHLTCDRHSQFRSCSLWSDVSDKRSAKIYIRHLHLQISFDLNYSSIDSEDDTDYIIHRKYKKNLNMFF